MRAHDLFVARCAAAAAASSRIDVSAVVETILSALYAPIMMLVQTQHIIEILTGRDSGWNAQRRHAHDDDLERSAGISTGRTCVIGIVIGVIAFLISPTLLAWLTPTLAGLLLAVPLSKISGSVQARSLARLVPRAAHAGREARAGGDPASRRVAGARRIDAARDGLRYIARNRQARYAHISGNLPRPQETRGHPTRIA